MIGFLLSWDPVDMEKQHFLSSAVETSFNDFKYEVPLNFQKNSCRWNTKVITIDWYCFWPTLILLDSPFDCVNVGDQSLEYLGEFENKTETLQKLYASAYEVWNMKNIRTEKTH